MKEDLTGLIETVAGESLAVGMFLFSKQLKIDTDKISSILGINSNKLDKWIQTGLVPVSELNEEEILKISGLVAVQRFIAAVFPDISTQRAWVSTRNPSLGSPPIDAMLTEDGLAAVQSLLLDELRNAWGSSNG
jgi:hypothetical protein